MYRQFVKMSRIKAINNGIKLAKEYIGENIDKILKVIESDVVLSDGTKSNLKNIVKENKLHDYPIRDFLMDKFYVTSVVESNDKRIEFVSIKLMMDVIGIDLFRTDKRVYIIRTKI